MVCKGNGQAWVQLWTEAEFEEEFGHAIDSHVLIVVCNGDAGSLIGSNDQMTARVVSGNRIDVLYSDTIAFGQNVRINYLVALF